MQNDLTQGNIFKTLVKFSIPYLISCFLQTFYGLADLFITGLFNDAPVISAVSTGSQVTHMLVVIITGLSMGLTVFTGNAIGSKDRKRAARGIGNSIVFFSVFSVIAAIVLILSVELILKTINTPKEAFSQTKAYLLICFAGVPFITAYNVTGSIFRGMGDSRSPMYFVTGAGVINIILDYIFIGIFKMQAEGAALATIISQFASVIPALVSLRRLDMGIHLSRQDFRINKNTLSPILKTGIPVSFQDGLIQVSFLIITALANSMGVTAAAAAGIVEKIICFLFLVPSSMLSSISVLTAHNAGAGLHERGKKALYYGMGICIIFGTAAALACQFTAEWLVSLFAHNDKNVILAGSQYLKIYVFDCIFAGIHFCFSGYFCAYGKSIYSFIQNFLSIILVRIPGAFLFSWLYPGTLGHMGIAAPAGSLLSALICILIYIKVFKNGSKP